MRPDSDGRWPAESRLGGFARLAFGMTLLVLFGVVTQWLAPAPLLAAPITTPGVYAVPPQDRATSALACPNSLVQCDPKHTSYTKSTPDELTYWVLSAQGDGPACSSTGETAGCGAGGLDWHNPDGNAAVGSVRGRPFTVPVGVSAVRLRLKHLCQAPTVGATGAVTLQVLAWDGVTSIGSGTCSAPSSCSTAPDCVVGPISVAAGTEYLAQINVNASGTQSSFLAGRFSVEPTASSVAFWSNGFVRVDADGIQWGANSAPGTWSQPRRPDALAYSEIRFTTNASTVYVGTWANGHDYWANTAANDTRASFTVDTGSGTQSIVPENQGGTGASERRVRFSAVSNPVVGGAPSALTLRSGQQAASAWPAPATEPRGVYFEGLYVPSGYYVSVAQPPKPWAVGATDSKGVAYPSSPATSLPGLLRARGYGVDWWGIGGDTLANHVPSASVAAAWPWAQSVAQHSPALVLLQLQRNDWTGGTASATIYGLQESAYDAVAKAVPWTKWRVLQITKEATENTIGGVAWDTHRANVKANACSGNSAVDSQARSLGCTVTQTDGLWTSAECGATTCVTPASCVDRWCACGASRCANDQVHLADGGYERMAELLSGERYPIPSVLASAVGWWASDYGVAGTPGTATLGGTSPPAMSLSGSCSARRFAWEVASASGAAGTLRLSYDGGHSWPENPVPFATTGQAIALPVTPGLTASGCSLVMPSGSYNNLHSGRADNNANTWAPVAGSAGGMVVYNASNPMGWSAADSNFSGRPTVTAATSKYLKVTGLSVAPPYAIVLIVKAGATTSDVAIGRTGSTAGILIYTSSGTWALNDGTGQITSGAVTTTSPHCLIVNYAGASSSTIYVDGVSSGTGVTGGTNTLTNAILGFDPVSTLSGTPTIAEWALISGGVTADQARGICARSAFKYGTP